MKFNKSISVPTVLGTAILIASTSSVYAGGNQRSAQRSIPSVVVTVENAAPSRGAFQTPFWVGAHNGLFDIYDRNVALGDVDTNENLVPSPAVERLAEDGTTGPISDEFTTLQPGSPQATLLGPSGPIAPSETSSTTLNVNPQNDRFFSYASMVIPSNDAFIANGNPEAHELFNENGRFVGENFSVAGTEILDAGTEINDEIAGNTAFLNQGAPDTGATENGVITIHPGFLTDSIFPNGVLTLPALGGADFVNNPNYRAANFKFRYVDLGRTVRFAAKANASQEVTGNAIDSDGIAKAFIVSRNAEQIFVFVRFRNLTGPLTAAHLHNAQAGVNGPIVADLGDGIRSNGVRFVIKTEDVTGPLADGDEPLVGLLNELAAGNIYLNLHTAANPAGEIRGQVKLR